VINIKYIIENIKKLKKEKNAVIIAHHYAPVEIHEVCDVLGDSRGVFEAVKKGFDEEIIVTVMPYFFGEIIKAILPDKKILIPVKSRCPVANNPELSFDKISAFKEKYPNIPLVCYATSPFKIKLLADKLAFPGEVVRVIDEINSDKVLFVGEKNCTEEALMKCKNEVIPYEGNPVCNVYSSATIHDVNKLKEKYPNMYLMVHPECRKEILNVADEVCGTGEMYEIIKNTDYETYVLGVEKGFYDRVINEIPNKNVIHLSPYLVCNAFKTFRISDVENSLINLTEEIIVDNAVAKKLKDVVDDLVNP